ncbi:START domain-containing protein [Tanacetum coccineum]
MTPPDAIFNENEDESEPLRSELTEIRLNMTTGKSTRRVIVSGMNLDMKQTSVHRWPHATATNTCGSVITLVLPMLVEGNQPLQEKRQQVIESITLAINQTVERVKEALDKQRPPSPRAERLTDEQSKSCKKSFDCRT